MDLLKNLDNMSKILTAEEFQNSDYLFKTYGRELFVDELMIEFTKLHVEEALKQASENFKMKIKEDVYDLDMNDDWMEVDKNSILNAYPLKNIK